jgi:uncharacterized protein (DUF2235 family)
LDTSRGSNQIAFYDNGVGTSPFTPMAILGLAFGFGLAHNVRQIYGFLCRTYEPGDEIYTFGFSRGAFTIRVVVALIASQGIICPDTPKDERDMERLIDYAYRRFRRDSFTPSFLSFFLRPLRDCLLWLREVILRRKSYDPAKNYGFSDLPVADDLIKFIGVWDTVDAYGLPIDELTVGWDKVVWPLSAKDRDLSIRVSRACQALALDERRESFEPMLWNEKSEENDRLMQVWFPGVHSNVGGGYPDDALALVALNWILDESERNNGLQYIAVERERYRAQACMDGKIQNSRSGVGNLYRYEPRNLERLGRQKRPGLWNTLKKSARRPTLDENEVYIEKPKLHHSLSCAKY